MSLSACLIVKNEEQWLAGCLESLQGVADEIVLVDTGSTDQTLQIAQDFTLQGSSKHSHQVKIYQPEKSLFTSEDGLFHFAKARNISLAHATQEWCLWIDADERIPEANKENYLRLTADKPDHPFAYNVNIINYHGGHITTALNFRVWSNHYDVQFQGRVHEQIIPTFNALPDRELAWSTLRLDHYGYQGDQTVKTDRNEEIMQPVLEANPDDTYTRFTLAQSYLTNGRWDQGLQELHRVEDNVDEYQGQFRSAIWNSLAQCYLHRKEYGIAYDYIIKSLADEPRQVLAWNMLSHWYYVQNKFELSRNAFQDMIDYHQFCTTKTHLVAHDVEIRDEQIQSTEWHLNTQCHELVPGDIITHQDGTQDVIDRNGQWRRIQ